MSFLQAAHAYDAAARRIRGPSSICNFPMPKVGEPSPAPEATAIAIDAVDQARAKAAGAPSPAKQDSPASETSETCMDTAMEDRQTQSADSAIPNS